MSKMVVTELKRFKKTSRKIHFLCKCDDKCIIEISEIMRNFLDNNFKLPKMKKITRNLRSLRFNLRMLADSQVSIRDKRKLLIGFGARALLYPLLCKILKLKQQEEKEEKK